MDLFDGHDLGTSTHPSGDGYKVIIWQETHDPESSDCVGEMTGVFELFSSTWFNYFKEQGSSVSEISFLSIPRPTILFSVSVSRQHPCGERGEGT